MLLTCEVGKARGEDHKVCVGAIKIPLFLEGLSLQCACRLGAWRRHREPARAPGILQSLVAGPRLASNCPLCRKVVLPAAAHLCVCEVFQEPAGNPSWLVKGLPVPGFVLGSLSASLLLSHSQGCPGRYWRELACPPAVPFMGGGDIKPHLKSQVPRQWGAQWREGAGCCSAARCRLRWGNLGPELLSVLVTVRRPGQTAEEGRHRPPTSTSDLRVLGSLRLAAHCWPSREAPCGQRLPRAVPQLRSFGAGDMPGLVTCRAA